MCRPAIVTPLCPCPTEAGSGRKPKGRGLTDEPRQASVPTYGHPAVPQGSGRVRCRTTRRGPRACAVSALIRPQTRAGPWNYALMLHTVHDGALPLRRPKFVDVTRARYHPRPAHSLYHKRVGVISKCDGERGPQGRAGCGGARPQRTDRRSAVAPDRPLPVVSGAARARPGLRNWH